MLSPTDPAAPIFLAAYLGLLSLGFAVVRPAGWMRWPLAVVMLCALVRLIPAVVLPMGAEYDITSYRLVGQATATGQDLYALSDLANRYPYLPGWNLVEAAAWWLSGGGSGWFVLLIKMPGIAADCAIAWLLWRHAGHWPAVLFALSPTSAMVTGAHGQFDALPLLAVTVSLTRRDVLSAGGFLGAGIWLKTWPAMFLLGLVRFGGSRRWAGVVAAVGVAGVGATVAGLLSHASPAEVLARVSGYYSVPNWGPWAVLWAWPQALPAARVLAVLAIVGSYWLLSRRLDPLRSALALVLLFLLLAPGNSVQAVSWIGPVALLAGEARWFRAWVLATLPYVAAAYFGVVMFSLLPADWNLWLVWLGASMVSWYVAALWLFVLRRRGSAVVASTSFAFRRALATPEVVGQEASA